ncbi:MAG: c-type cytochrome biogenesis protein CcmI, partial [Gammaproteobacteria bacterium]
MTVFWGLAAVMMAVALLFTVPWVLRSSRSAAADPDALNTELIKTQLAELKADLEAGRLEESQYAAARQDLERELLDDLAQPSAAGAAHKVRGGQWVAVLLVLLIPGLAVGLYQTIGTQQIIPLLERNAAAPAARAEPASGQHSLEEMIGKLAERLRANPDDLRGWMLLGRSYESLRRFPDAVNAYANAYRINADHPEVLAAYADALVMANGGRFNDQAGGLLEHALEIQPDNIKALWLLGHWKNQQADYQAAIGHWQRAAALLPAGSEDAGVIAQQIQVARSQLG